LPLLFWLVPPPEPCAAAARFQGRFIGHRLGLLPALIWWLSAIPALLVLLGSASLALVLRASESWNRVLLVSSDGSGVFSGAGAALASDRVLAQGFEKVMPSLGEVYQTGREPRLRPDCTGPDRPDCGNVANVSVLSLMLGATGRRCCTTRVVSVASFAHLNPAGPAMLLLAGWCGSELRVQMSMLVLLCSVPLVFAGMALIHGLVAQATGQVLAGGVVRDAAAVHAADLSVARGFGHCRQPD
jgi:hypothetical protein